MGKTWVITGASRGIGLEMVRQLLGAGEMVVVLARHLNSAEALQELKRRAPQHLTLIEADVNRDADVAQAVSSLNGKSVDYLINNAGILRETDLSLKALHLSVVEEQIRVNALGPLRVTQAFLPLLNKADHPVVANITSKMGSIADTSSGAYGYRMSKAALNMFTKCLAAELPNGIALSLHPGWVKTDMGGAGAMVETADSVAGLLKVIRSATRAQSGGFFGYRGEMIPW